MNVFIINNKSVEESTYKATWCFTVMINKSVYRYRSMNSYRCVEFKRQLHGSQIALRELANMYSARCCTPNIFRILGQSRSLCSWTDLTKINMCHCSVHYLNFFFFARKVYRQYRLAFPISISDSFGNTNFSFQTLIEGVTRRNTCYIIRIIVRFLSKKDSGSKNKTLILFKESSTRLLPLNTNHYIYEPMQESLFMQTIDDRRNASLKSLSPLSSYYYHPPTNASAK